MTGHRHPASLRDPAGKLMKCANRLIRFVYPDFADTYRTLLDEVWFKDLVQAGEVVDSVLLPPEEFSSAGTPSEPGSICIEHKRNNFPSYPSEWPLEMLCAAAELTLKLCLSALEQGYGLKDATPFNVLFWGPRPVFVDLLSFEKRTAGDPTWLANGQFVRSFLLPILLDTRYGMACHTTYFARRDGIEPEEVYRLLTPFARITPPFLGNVTMPVLLSEHAERQSGKVYSRKILSDPDQATFILHSLFARLTRTIQNSSARRHQSKTWTTYNETCTYTAADSAQKTAFVEQFLQSSGPTRVLDVGCNTGRFSFLAARYGAEVVATDLVSEVVGSLWQRAIKEQANILPLVVNLARPTPAMGCVTVRPSHFWIVPKGILTQCLCLRLSIIY